MEKNVGKIDGVIRIVLALVLFSMFFTLDGNDRLLGLLFLVPLLTSLASFCPLYKLLGINTCRVDSPKK